MNEIDGSSEALWAELVAHGVLERELVEAFRLATPGDPWVPLGKVMLDEGVITLRQVMDVLAAQSAAPEARFGEIAVRDGHCTVADVRRCLDIQARETPGSIEYALADVDVPPGRVIAALASYARYLERRIESGATAAA